MNLRKLELVVLGMLAWLIAGGSLSHAQQELGFIERFATASDRRDVLGELIPGTEDYYYYHCLHAQNTGELAAAQAMLDQWKAKYGENAGVARMIARQMLLSYDTAPESTLRYLRGRLNIELNHGPPSRDRAAALASRVTAEQLAPERLLEAALNRDRSLSQIATSALPGLVNRSFAPDQLRAWLGRLDRADFAGVVKRIAEELALQDSATFGWAAVHQLLTLEQLEELLRLRPSLLEQETYIRNYAIRLLPADGMALDDPRELRAYIERLLKFARTLPASQNNLKTLVLGNLLRLNLRENQWNRELFLEYLALPRRAPYYAVERWQNQALSWVELNYTLAPHIALPAVGDDAPLVRRYLEHFFQASDKSDDLARYLERGYLERVLAETKILYGAGDPAAWYAKLGPAEQQALRERIELRFGPHSQTTYTASDTAQLSLELKNVQQLLIRIYRIDIRNHYRQQQRPISTDIDLDGLVANAERKLEYAQPAERRHVETLPLPELAGSGVWVVDVLGGGQRSRALIQKGNLFSLQRLTDAGHVVRVFNEAGQLVKSAAVELGGRQFAADDQGEILIPYSQSQQTQTVLLVDGDFAVAEQLLLHDEQYQLDAAFVMDRQALVAGTQASLLLRARLACNGRPTSLQLLEKPQVTIVATDIDGIATTQTISDLKLSDSSEWGHQFLVPQRLAQVQFTLSGQVAKQSRDERQAVSASQTIVCNELNRTTVVGGFFLRETDQGYRMLVLGRNGEPLAKLPVNLSFNAVDVTLAETLTLATDALGEIDLGPLPRIASVSLSAQGVHDASFVLEHSDRYWPATIHAATQSEIVLPLGSASVATTSLSLTEVRQGVNYRTLTDRLKSEPGRVVIAGLPVGSYRLRDHRSGQSVSIAVVDAQASDDQYWIGQWRALESSRQQPVAIDEVRVADQEITVRLSGYDQHTRLHVLASPFKPTLDPAAQIHLPAPPLSETVRHRTPSLYIDSLQLDEEYRYILERQQATKYPGNMLPQPGLLIHPWEISLSENQRKEARAGDALPNQSAPADAAQRAAAPAPKSIPPAATSSTGYDFLAQGTLVVANLPVDERGQVVIPRQNLQGYSSLTVLAVHPTTSDSRHVALPPTPLRQRDQRLKESFASDSHLVKKQTVRVLTVDQPTTLGDARTSRVQLYVTLADAFRLYGTLLNQPQWDKFRFVTQWPNLSDTERRARYSELACHELNFFLAHKDRPFFDAVVAPLLADKLDKQLIDLWLLGRPLDEYRPLWRVERLNTLERILLADKLPDLAEGTRRWLGDCLEARPMDPQARSARFETALRGSVLDIAAGKNFLFGAQARDQSGRQLGEQAGMPGAAAGATTLGGMMGGRGGANAAASDAMPAIQMEALGLAEAELLERSKQAGDKLADEKGARELFRADRAVRGRRSAGKEQFFQSLDQTREWAESQYYHVRLQNQNAALIPPGLFWQELLLSRSPAGERSKFLSQNIDLPVSSINEALCALAVIDLPWTAEPAKMLVEDERLVVTSASPAIAYVESVEPALDSDGRSSILAGRDIYLVEPHADEQSNRPVQSQPLLIGVPYRATVVVTNPSNSKKRVQVLYQLPAGAIALAGSQVTSAKTIELEAYSTAQVEYSFYFPEAGEFTHYPSQVSSDGKHLIATTTETLRVLAEPESVDESTWMMVADWGTNEQVLKYLEQHNLQRLDVSRIAFRMQDKAFYTQVLNLLSQRQHYDAILWGYALQHNDAPNINQLLQQRPDFSAGLGPSLKSRLLTLEPHEQMSYEHLDYKPLVVARLHQLGSKRVMLNERLYAQYVRLLSVLAHQANLTDAQRLELCYYALLQNRIQEAIQWFDAIEQAQVVQRVPYDYLSAYLDFFRGQYDRARQTAGRYEAYPVPKWSDMFAQVTNQIQQREALMAGQAWTAAAASDAKPLERAERVMTDNREAQQASQVAAAPSLELSVSEGTATIQYRNLEQVHVNYYLMDIELLFSRNPFVAQGSERLPVIRPNMSQVIQMPAVSGLRALELPEEVRNRNVLVEVTAKGISRSRVLTASTLEVSMMEPFGRLQVRSQLNRQPVAGAYIKVYARHRDGQVRFFKDGYTDLRGEFGYATLSTGDLDTTQRLAVLIIDPQHGAVVREAEPPTR